MVTTRESLTIQQVAELAEVTPRTVRNWLKRGKLSYHREEDVRKIFRDELETFLEGRERDEEGSEEDRPREQSLERLLDILEKERERLERERERSERLARENMEMAGRLGFYQGKVQEMEQRILFLSPPTSKETGEGKGDHEETGPSLPWWKRLFGGS